MKERPILFSGRMVREVMAERKDKTRRVMKEPWRIRLTHSVRADFPFGRALSFGGRRAAPPGIYKAHHNPYGAVSVVDDNGELLGVRPDEFEWVSPYGHAGDRLWVREAAYIAPPDFGDASDANCQDDQGRPRVVGWAASMDGESVRCATDYGVKKTPSIHMPRWASRITLEVVSVGVERLQSISDEDICRELGAPLQWAGEGPEPYARNLRGSFSELWDMLNDRRAPWASNPWVWVVEFKLLEVRK